MVARIEGTGIATPSKESSTKATAFIKDFMKFQNKADEKFIKTYERKQESGIQNSDFETNKYNKLKQKYGDQFSSDARSNYFSPGGGAFDERNNVQVASASGDFSGTFNESDFQGYMKALDIKRPKALPPTMLRMLKQNYQDDVRDGLYKEGQLINKAPVQEKPSFVEQTKNLAGSIFNAATGTQPAAASQIPGGMPTGTQFTSSNLDAAKAPTGDTSFASYRMAGQPSGGEQRQQGSGIVTPFSQTSMGKGEGRKVTPFSETSMGKGEPVKVTPFRQTSMGNKTVTVDGQKVAAKQTVASLPSDYKQTEAREFAKAAAFQQAKKNPNVTTSIDSKGQVTVKPVQKTRADAGASANTAEGNQARVKQNAVARAQAAAINRKISGKSISQVKAANRESMRAAAAERQATFKKTGKSTAAARKAAAKASMKAKAKARHASFKKKRAAAKAAKAKAKARKKAFSKGGARNKRRRRSRGRRRCDIFLKYNISPLVNMNLIRDDLAEVAYFVKEIQE